MRGNDKHHTNHSSWPILYALLFEAVLAVEMALLELAVLAFHQDGAKVWTPIRFLVGPLRN